MFENWLETQIEKKMIELEILIYCRNGIQKCKEVLPCPIHDDDDGLFLRYR